MLNRYLTYYRIGLQFVIFLAILSFFWLFGGSLQGVLQQYFLGMPLESITSYNIQLAHQIKFFNVAMLAMLLLLPALVFAYLAYPSASQYLGLKKQSSVKFILWAICMFILASPFSALLETWNKDLHIFKQSAVADEKLSALYVAMLQGKSGGDLLINLLFICVAPALIEEIFFRGCLQQLFTNWLRKLPWLSVILVAVIFSAFHGQMSAFFPRLFLGILLGLVYHFSGNLWISILLHFINNTITVLWMFMFNAGQTNINPLTLPEISPILGWASVAITIFLLIVLYKKSISFPIYEVEKDQAWSDFLEKN